MKESPWDVFFKEKISKIFLEKNNILDIGGGLRIYKDKGNRYDNSREWIIPLMKPGQCKIMDPVSDYQPDIVGDIHHMPFGNDSFDALLCLAVLEHVENPILAAEEMYRVLQPGGMCFVYVPFLFYYHAEVGYYGDFWRFTEDSLRYIFRNFKTIDIMPVRGAIATWLHISPLGKSNLLTRIAHWLDRVTGKLKTKQVSGFNVYLEK